MGADVMRWLYCQQPPNQDLLFGFGPGQEVRRKLLTLWNSVTFFVQYANIAGFTPGLADLDRAAGAAGEAESLDRWLVHRTRRLVAEATDGYERYLTVEVLRAFDRYVDDLSNWYIRRSRRRFWDGDEAALRTLWVALVQSLRVIAPVMPFLTEHLWQALVVDVCPGAADSIFLAGWPEATGDAIDDELLDDMAAVRRVVDLGRQARAAAQLRLRQPLHQLVIEGTDRVAPHLDLIAEELRVTTARLERIEATQLRVRPNLPLLGPRLGRDVAELRRALAEGEFRELDDGGIEVAGHRLGPDEVLVERTEKEGWAIASDDGVTVALDTTLDDELRRQGRVHELVHRVNTMRKESGLALTDRIALMLPSSDRDLLDHRDWIATETLATSIDLSPDGELHLTRTATA
jgi:isoleucyl-tRNA synthetase